MKGLALDCLLKTILGLYTIDTTKSFQFPVPISSEIEVDRGRYSKAYPKVYNMDKSFIPEYILDLKMETMYEWAMSQYLPIGQLEYSNKTLEDILSCSVDSEYGYILEVELDSTNIDFPFGRKLNMTKNTLFVHYQLLQFYVQIGVIIISVDAIIQFKQEKWIEGYSCNNFVMATSSGNKFDCIIFKSMNHCLFGLMEKTFLANETCVNKNGHDTNSSHLFDYIKLSIMDLAIFKIYSFYYHFLKVKYDKNVCVLYHFCDRLIVKIRTNNVYSDILADPEWFDFTNRPNSDLKELANSIGKIRDNSGWKLINYFENKTTIPFEIPF
jgi:hypothetical protein